MPLLFALAAPFMAAQPATSFRYSSAGESDYFSSAAGAADTEIFYTERTETGWGDAVRLGRPVKTRGDEFHP